jgi:hypothetical protein
VRLVGQHMWGPAVSVGLPSFVFPFDATKANFGGGVTDLLEVLASRGWVELGSRGAWVGGKPFLHVGLILIFGGLVFEDVGYLAYFLVVWRGRWVLSLGGGLLGCGRSSKRAGVCLRWWLGSGQYGSLEGMALWGLGKSEYGQSTRQW